MRFRFTILFLALALFISACGGNTNTNANRATPTPTATPIAANTDPALKTNIEAELKKKGFNNVTVDVTTTPATLRGTYPKGKLADVIQTAQQANGMKPLQNQMSEDK
ncbi:MAG: hypothetical protein ABR530_02655 [Pyrinomonadaceae bacterium]